MTDQREDFEEAAARMGYSLRMRDPASEDGEYGDRETQCAWDMWQECRDKARTITPAMIEAGAQRLVRWEDDCVWPDSWGPVALAGARQDAERVIRSALSVMGGGDD